jgi:hypothetical protein
VRKKLSDKLTLEDEASPINSKWQLSKNFIYRFQPEPGCHRENAQNSGQGLFKAGSGITDLRFSCSIAAVSNLASAASFAWKISIHATNPNPSNFMTLMPLAWLASVGQPSYLSI